MTIGRITLKELVEKDPPLSRRNQHFILPRGVRFRDALCTNTSQIVRRPAHRNTSFLVEPVRCARAM
jgi:hypothetical protein